MEKYTYIEILIEDKSGAILVEQIMKKYAMDKTDFHFRIHSFKGIGKIPAKANQMSQIKSKRLLTDLPMYLKGMSLSMEAMGGKKAIFVILDSDNDNCADIKNDLLKMYHEMKISVQVFFCIAIEEMEAWLLGDGDALVRAYPMCKRQLLQRYVQDSVIGTWEYLADIVYKGGVQTLKSNASSYYEIGKFKCECAKEIGQFLDITRNASPSFHYFISKLDSVYGSSA